MNAEEAVVFEGCEAVVRATYDALMRSVLRYGPVGIEAKKSSITLVAGSAFAILHPKKTALVLAIRTEKPLASPRVRKVEAVARNVYHNEILLNAPGAVDPELLRWVKAAYALGAEKPA
jgi:hypothetical protein